MPMKRNKKGYVGGGKMKKKGMAAGGRTTMKKQMMRGGGATGMKKKMYAGGQDSVNNTPIYYDFNFAGDYFFRIYSVYEDPTINGGSGTYSLSILLKPQNNPPEVQPGAISKLYLEEDNIPWILDLNNTIFFAKGV